MRKIITILWVTLAIVAFITAPLGCKPKQADAPASANTPVNRLGYNASWKCSVAEHEVKADLYGDGGVTDPGVQTVQEFLPVELFGVGHRLSIQTERLSIDGREAAKIPAGAKLQIVVSNAMLSVTADGTNVLSTTITTIKK